MSRITKSLTDERIRTLLTQAYGNPPKKPIFHQELPPGLLQDPPQKAAVLVPFVLESNQWHILFTRRTATLPEHSGQVAFPGGRADFEHERPEQTALREAKEEINLDPQDVCILGRLHEIRTISNYCVAPVVGRIPSSYAFTLAPVEVSRVFTIPLDWLVAPANHEIRMRELPIPFPPVPVIYFKPYDGELLWGVSAEITIKLLIALQLIDEVD